jgi:tetratricopeptide (TPR) repeat protein
MNNRKFKTIAFLWLLAGGIMFPATQEPPQDLPAMIKAAEGLLDWQYFAEAQNSYVEIRRQYPQAGGLDEPLGYICLAQRKYAEAIGYFERELARTPANDLAGLLLGLAHFQAGNAATARELVGKAATHLSAAIKNPAFRKFLGDNPGLIPFVLGRLHRETGEWSDAEEMMAEAASQEYDLAEVMAQLIDQYMQRRDFAFAKLVLAKLAQENSQLAEVLDGIVKTQDVQKAGDFARSRPLVIRYFRRPIAAIIDELNRMARSAVERADPASAFRTWEKALFADDRRFDIHYNLALIYCLYNFKEEALFHCRRAIDLGDRQYQPWALNLAGNIRFEMGDFDLALGYYQQAIDLDPGYLKCRNNLGATYWKLGDPANAERQWLRVIQNSGKGKKENAILESAEEEKIKIVVDVKESDEMIEASKSLATLYIQQKHATQAVPLLERVLQFIPTDADAHFELGKIYAYMDQPALALPHLKAALKNGTKNEAEAISLFAKADKMMAH